MGRIDSYEAISKFTGNERIVVETDEGTRKAFFSQIQDKINDCVDNKAEMLNRNSVSVISDTESEYILDIIVGTTHITTPNLKGKAIKSINIETGHLIIRLSDDTSIDAGVVVGKDYILTEDDKSEIADIAAGRIDVEQIAEALNSTGGLKIFAASDSESAMVFMEKMYADFSTNVPVLFMPLFDDEEFGFQNGMGMIIIDSGSGQLDDAVIIPMSYSEYPLTENLYYKLGQAVDFVNMYGYYYTPKPLTVSSTVSNGFVCVNQVSGTAFSDFKPNKLLLSVFVPSSQKTYRFYLNSILTSNLFTIDLNAVTSDNELTQLDIEIELIDRSVLVKAVMVSDKGSSYYSAKGSISSSSLSALYLEKNSDITIHYAYGRR